MKQHNVTIIDPSVNEEQEEEEEGEKLEATIYSFKSFCGTLVNEFDAISHVPGCCQTIFMLKEYYVKPLRKNERKKGMAGSMMDFQYPLHC